FCCSCPDPPRHLHSFPTRRSSDLLPGPMTIVDTVADAHYGGRAKLAMAFAELLNQEARALQADGVDVIQFDEPAFNVFMDDVKGDRKSTRLNSSHVKTSYAVFCLK